MKIRVSEIWENKGKRDLRKWDVSASTSFFVTYPQKENSNDNFCQKNKINPPLGPFLFVFAQRKAASFWQKNHVKDPYDHVENKKNLMSSYLDTFLTERRTDKSGSGDSKKVCTLSKITLKERQRVCDGYFLFCFF